MLPCSGSQALAISVRQAVSLRFDTQTKRFRFRTENRSDNLRFPTVFVMAPTGEPFIAVFFGPLMIPVRPFGAHLDCCTCRTPLRSQATPGVQMIQYLFGLARLATHQKGVHSSKPAKSNPTYCAKRAPFFFLAPRSTPATSPRSSWWSSKVGGLLGCWAVVVRGKNRAGF